jgi:hypothetical protein
MTASVVHLTHARLARDQARLNAAGLRPPVCDQPVPPDSPLLWRRTHYAAWLLHRLAYFEAVIANGQNRRFHDLEHRKLSILVDQLDLADRMLRAELAPNVFILPRKKF